MPNAQSNSLTIAQRIQALALVEHGIAAKIVQEVTGVSTSSISALKIKARQRGYDPTVSRVLKVEYIEDAPRSGRPKKVTSEVEQAILNNVVQDRNSREKSSAMIGFDHKLSSTTILRTLKQNGFRPCKSTKKPGLDSIMKEARLQFCLRYQHWTIDDWKNVIWTDETSIILGSRRGRRLSGVPRKKCMLKRVFDVDGKDAPSFCFGAVFRTIRKDLFISGKQRLQKRKERLKLS